MLEFFRGYVKEQDKCVLMFWSEVNRPSTQTEHASQKEERELSSAPHFGRSVRRIEWPVKTLGPRGGCPRWLGRGGAVVKNCE